MAAQLVHWLPPSEVEAPSELLENEAKVEIARWALLLQPGQEDASWEQLMGRRNSNLSPQVEQRYSYSGIATILSRLCYIIPADKSIGLAAEYPLTPLFSTRLEPSLEGLHPRLDGFS